MYVAFEGPIGVGKTTLAQRFAEYRGPNSRLLLENFADNAFLKDFYADPSRWALPAQLEFLLSRHEQLNVPDMATETSVIADHSIIKDRVFAELLLEGRELALYDRVAASLEHHGTRPTVLVYLDADTDTLLARIRQRARSFEAGISAAYLKALRQVYERHLAGLPRQTRLLRMDTTAMNLSAHDALLPLWQHIDEAADSSHTQQ